MPVSVLSAPVDLASRETAAFLEAQLKSNAEIIEVGCGAGQVAAVLTAKGYQVVAIDSKAEAIQQARQLGVQASLAAWPEFEHRAVDAVAFTRSLHHIDPLNMAVAQAYQLLKPGGYLLVEDLDFDAADQATVDWFINAIQAPKIQRLLLSVEGALVTELLHCEQPAAVWYAHNHHHELHSAAAMRNEINTQFGAVEVSPSAYCYRYLIPVLPQTPAAAAVVSELYQQETVLAEQGRLILVGRRMVATKRRN